MMEDVQEAEEAWGMKGRGERVAENKGGSVGEREMTPTWAGLQAQGAKVGQCEEQV